MACIACAGSAAGQTAILGLADVLCCAAGHTAKVGDEEEGGDAAKPLAETADVPAASSSHASAVNVITGQHPSSTARRLQATKTAAAEVLP